MSRLHDGVRYLYGLHHPGEPYTLPLDLTPRPVINSTAPSHRIMELKGKCIACLRALLENNGTRTGSELEAIAGRRFGARLAELRPFLARIKGYEFVPMRKGSSAINNPIESEPIPGSKDYRYTLKDWAIPAAASVVFVRNIPPSES